MNKYAKIEDLTNEIIEKVLHSDEMKKAVFKSVRHLKDSDSPFAQFDSYSEIEIEIVETIDDFSRKMTETILRPHFGEMEEQMDNERMEDKLEQ